MRDLSNLIGSSWRASSAREWRSVVSPSTGEGIARMPLSTTADVDEVVAAARDAFTGWSRRTLDDRLTILESVATTIEAHVAELAETEAEEMGRPVAIGAEWIQAAVSAFRHTLSVAREYPFSATVAPDTSIERRPLGAVGLITPWNFPTNTILDALPALLASGNTVVLKPSEKSPLSAVRLAELIELPSGVFNLVLGDGGAGSALARHRDIALVHFTGSVSAGTAVAVATASRLNRAVLELGGKDPVIIDSGVDVDRIAQDVARGAFVNTGQICTSIERIYVHKDVADAFTRALVEAARSYQVGDPFEPATQLGPMVDGPQRDVVERHIEDAVAHGARVLIGGTTPDGNGTYYPATVLTDVTDEMLVMREETFGPIAPVCVVGSFREGIERARSSAYGLAATVYTNDPLHAQAAREIPAGLIWINKWQGGGSNVVYEPAGQSGMSANGHFASFDAATRPVSVISTILSGAAT